MSMIYLCHVIDLIIPKQITIYKYVMPIDICYILGLLMSCFMKIFVTEKSKSGILFEILTKIKMLLNK